MINITGYGIHKLRRWLSLTGGVPGHAGKDPIAHILFLKHEHPERYQQAYKFLEPKDYINLKFTGKFAASFDSIALHWITDNRNLAKVDYDDRLNRLNGQTGQSMAVPIFEIGSRSLSRCSNLAQNTRAYRGKMPLPLLKNAKWEWLPATN